LVEDIHKRRLRRKSEEITFAGIVLFLGWFGIYVEEKCFNLFVLFLVRASKNYPKII
jgi:hypothetical protein